MPINSPLSEIVRQGPIKLIDSRLRHTTAGTMKPFFAHLTASAIILFARFITSVRGVWLGIEPRAEQRIYFANHRSHGDFVLLWTVLPPPLRKRTRPVAGKDYWNKTAVKRFVGTDVFNALQIDRESSNRSADPVETMAASLDDGDSLIIFPEGTRNTGDEILLPFKSGLFHLASARPKVKLVPVWINNLNRVMPKGEFIPVPLVCTVTFGAAVQVQAGENKNDVLKRAEQALLSLSPDAPTTPSDTDR